jgi:hypothetical protein
MITVNKYSGAFVPSVALRLGATALGSPNIAAILSALIAGPSFAQPANYVDPAREQAIRQCMAIQNRDPHDGYEGRKGGDLQWHYQACVAERGQRP